jgi:hypothetical protein
MIFDQYSLLHIASGIIAYFWNLNLFSWFILHTLFELLENTQYSAQFITKYITFWPGGKQTIDSIPNMIGDTISAIIGWLIAYYLDYYGVKYKWYEGHLIK